MSDIPFIDGIEVDDFNEFETEGYSDEDALDLARGLLLSAIPCLERLYTDFSSLDKKNIKFAILEMAKYIKIDYYNFERATSPFQSETLGSYTYSKMVSSVRSGASTGVPAFDRAVGQYADLCNVDLGGGETMHSTEEVISPGYQKYRNTREMGNAAQSIYDVTYTWQAGTRVNP